MDGRLPGIGIRTLLETMLESKSRLTGLQVNGVLELEVR